MAQDISSSRKNITSEYLLYPSNETCHRKKRKIDDIRLNERDKNSLLDLQSTLRSSILIDEYASKVVNDVKVASEKLRKYYESKDNNDDRINGVR